MKIRQIRISICYPTGDMISCGYCESMADGQQWGSETDIQGNVFGCCPICGKESLLVFSDEYTHGEVIKND